MPLISPEKVRWRLKQEHGGKIFDINATDNYMVGRSPTAQIILNSNKTSRTHSSFVVNVEGHLLVQDLKSINGTFVNGTQISVYVLHRLFQGDKISFGMGDMEQSENDKDRQTFFLVIYEEPPIPAMPPVEANLADSTTDLRDNAVVINSNQSSIRNSTAEIRINSCSDLLELPSSSDERKEVVDVIDITSSTGDDEKPDIDLNDYVEEHNNIAALKIIDVRSAPERSPERKQVNSNWLQKKPSPKKFAKNRKSSDLQETRSGVNTSKSITSKQARDFFKTSESENRKDRNGDLNNSRSTPLNIEDKEEDVPNMIKKSFCNSKQQNNEKAKTPASIPFRRKSLAGSNPEREDNFFRRKSVGGDSRHTEKDISEAKSHPIENSKVKKLAGIRRKTLTVSYPEREDEHPRENITDSSKKKTVKIETISPNQVKMSSTRTLVETSDTRELKYASRRKSFAGDTPNETKETGPKNSKQIEITSAEKGSSEKKSVDNEKTAGDKISSKKNSVALGSGDGHANKEKYKKKLGDKNSRCLYSEKDKSHDLILELDEAIFGKDDSSPKETKINILQRAEKIKKKYPEERELKTPPLHKHKKVKVDDCDEFIFGSHTGITRDEPRENRNSSKDLSVVNELNKDLDNQKKCMTKENKDNIKNQNEYVKYLECKCYEPSTFSDKIKCPVHDAHCSNRNKSSEKHNDNAENYPRHTKILQKSFTTDKDNSIIIDITDDNADETDFSYSQIFQMSQIVKSEVPDDTFQKIKNELAEMDFCEEETIINPVPINLENDMSGFENTQDICACLEEVDDGNKNNDNFISNEENEELLKIFEETDKNSGNKDDKADPEDMDISFDESSVSSKNNQNDHAASKEETSYEKIDCVSGKPKYGKPPIIQAHTIAKPPKKSPNKADSKSNKRKNSLETPTKKKKIKGAKNVAEPPRSDSKSIQKEFKKRNSGSKMDQDSKLHKDNIREERRKKLKEISERRTSPKATESRCVKGNTVKVLPESKTRRGSFLCEELKKSSGDIIKSKVHKKYGESSIQKKDVEKERNDRYPNLECKCHGAGTSGRQIECPVHAVNPSIDTSGINHNRSFHTNDDQKPKTPTTGLINYKLKPLDLPEPTLLSSKYNLRRAKSSGDIKADLIKSKDDLRSGEAQSYYNLRRSTHNVEDFRQNKVDARNYRPVLPPAYHANSTLMPPYVNQRPQYGFPLRTNQMPMPAVSYNPVSRTTRDLSSSLMWTNGGPSNNRRAPVRHLPVVDEVVHKMVHWLPNWLQEQVTIDYSAPVNSPPATQIPLNFQNFEQYRDTFSKLVLLENWQYLFKGFREGAEEPRKVKIEHYRVTNDLVTIDCISYITRQELRLGLFYKPEDFVLFEYVVNDEENSYMSLNFGIIQSCKKTIISNNDIISIMRYYCQGEPHMKLEFSILSRYQPDKEINKGKFPIVKLLANIRAHLMLLKAIKGLVDSPICSKILYPKINEYKFPVTHHDIIQPHSLNTRQRSIVLEAASLCTGKDNGIYCIKGPPGTGKSTVIVNLVFQILFSHYVTKKTKEPPMILLAAPSNTAVDNLLAKLIAFKRSLGTEWDKYKPQIKCVRIGPEASINKDLIGYSLPKLAEKHVPIKHMDTPEFRAARERNENLVESSKYILGDRYAYEIKSCEDLIIEKSNIICTTLNSCINGKLIEAVNRGLIKFSCCIIDEATQCHEVEALLPTILGIDKFVLVGDPKQLNATVMNRDAFKLGFGESLFSRISNNFTNDPRTPIRMLSDQYRMHPEICAFPNKHFYEGKLRSVPKHPNKLPEKIRPYLVFNCEKFSDSGDYTNMDEINLIKKLLGTILGMIDRSHKCTVGIISPYNAQKDLINHNIGELSKNSNCKITVNTVDSFQGSENDIIIISCVRHSTNSFLQNEHRLNVALTRAKQALYIIGNYTLFKECRPLYDLREDAKKRRLLLDIRQDPVTINNFGRYLIKKKL